MKCEECRESLSARLDGEDDLEERVAADTHLASCPDCRLWLDRAATVTRLARLGLATAAPGVPETVVDTAPGRRRLVLEAALRIGLVIAGGGQVLLAVAQIAMPAMRVTTIAGDMQGASANHLVHESAAWNLALGAAFLLIAWRRSRPAGVLPTLSVFVAVLTVLSIEDILDGAVQIGRLISHGLLFLGYGCVVALYRIAPSDPGPSGSASRTPGSRWRLSTAENVVELPATRSVGPAARVPDRAA